MLGVEVGEPDLKRHVMIYVIGVDRAGIRLLWARGREDKWRNFLLVGVDLPSIVSIFPNE